MAAQLLHPPTFHDDGASVTVTLRLSGLVTPLERAWLSRLMQNRGLETNDLLALVQSVRDGSVTNSRVRSFLGVDNVVARVILQRLRDAGLVVHEGERGGAVYRPTENLGIPAMIRVDPAELEERVVEMVENEPISNADVRTATGLDSNDALTMLQRLVAAGRLTQTGAKRGTRYRAT